MFSRDPDWHGSVRPHGRAHVQVALSAWSRIEDVDEHHHHHIRDTLRGSTTRALHVPVLNYGEGDDVSDHEHCAGCRILIREFRGRCRRQVPAGGDACEICVVLVCWCVCGVVPAANTDPAADAGRSYAQLHAVTVAQQFPHVGGARSS